MHRPYFLYLLFSCWASWLIPQFGNCEENSNEHGCASISIAYGFTLLQLYAEKCYGRVIRRVYF
jgi:hypothetical protein